MTDNESVEARVARIDERTMTTATNIAALRDDIEALRKSLRENFVTAKEFAPVRLISFGLVSIVMVGVIGAIVASVLG